MAPSLSVGQIAEVKLMIEDYIKRRRRLFPEVSLRSRHHYMTHYAQMTAVWPTY